jgi:hypothetical protein
MSSLLQVRQTFLNIGDAFESKDRCHLLSGQPAPAIVRVSVIRQDLDQIELSIRYLLGSKQMPPMGIDAHS